MRTVALLLALTVTAAADPSSAPGWYELGKHLYDQGQWAASADAFQHAYDLDPQPILLYNIGQSFRRAGDCPRAIDAYRRYLAAAPGAPNHGKVDGWIELCSGAIDNEAVAPPYVAPSPWPHRWHLAGLASAVIGVVATSLAIDQSLRARADARMIGQVCAQGCAAGQVDSIDADGRAARRDAIALYLGGGVALAVGVGLSFKF